MENQSLFKNKNFMLVFFGALVSNIGAILYSFAVSFYILKITDNNSIIQGVYLAVVGVVTLIFTVLGGVFADRFHKGKIMYLCDFGKGIVLALPTIIMLFVSDRGVVLFLLFFVGVVGSVFSGIFSPASSALIPDIVEEKQLQQANSYFTLLQSVQSIIGIVLAGVLYAAIPITALFFIVAGCYIASAISEMFISYNHQRREDKLTVKSSLKEIGEGFKYVYSKKALFVLTIACLFINFFFVPVESNYLPFFISNDVASSDYLFKETLDPVMWNSIISVLFCVGMIVGSVSISCIKYKKVSRMVKTWLIIDGILLLLVAVNNLLFNDIWKYINPCLLILCFLFICSGFAIPLINVPVNTSIQKITDKQMMGKVNAFLSVGSQGLTPLASLLAGIIISGLGSTTLLFICAFGILLSVIILFKSKDFSAL